MLITLKTETDSRKEAIKEAEKYMKANNINLEITAMYHAIYTVGMWYVYAY